MVEEQKAEEQHEASLKSEGERVLDEDAQTDVFVGEEGESLGAGGEYRAPSKQVILLAIVCVVIVVLSLLYVWGTRVGQQSTLAPAPGLRVVAEEQRNSVPTAQSDTAVAVPTLADIEAQLDSVTLIDPRFEMERVQRELAAALEELE